MPGIKGGVYQRGSFWLDFARGAGGEPVSPFFYINWYDAGRGRQRRKSTGTGDVRLACDALDAHYLATHRPDEHERRSYTVAQAMTDYYIEIGSKRTSSVSIKARLLLFTRFMAVEAAAGRLHDPFLPEHVDDQLLDRFREWGVADPIIARRKNAAGDWQRTGAQRVRAVSTVEESVIQLGAALNNAKKRKRISAAKSCSLGPIVRRSAFAWIERSMPVLVCRAFSRWASQMASISMSGASREIGTPPLAASCPCRAPCRLRSRLSMSRRSFDWSSGGLMKEKRILRVTMSLSPFSVSRGPSRVVNMVSIKVSESLVQRLRNGNARNRIVPPPVRPWRRADRQPSCHHDGLARGGGGPAAPVVHIGDRPQG